MIDGLVFRDDRLDAWMEARGLSSAEVADVTTLSYNYLYMLRLGRRPNVSAVNLMRLARLVVRGTLDESQHDVLLDEIEKRAERLLSQRADIQRRRLELAEQAGRAVRLADVAAAGPGILQDNDVRAVNTWLRRHVRLYVANNHITLVEWL